MTSNPYVPTVEVVRDAVTFPRERLGEPRPICGEAFDRFVAKIKADAWAEGYRAGYEHGDPMGDTDFPPPNPYRIEDEA